MRNWHAMKNSPHVLVVAYIPKNTISIGTRLALTYSSTVYVAIGSIVSSPKCEVQMRDDALEASFAVISEPKSAFVNIKYSAAHHQQSVNKERYLCSC